MIAALKSASRLVVLALLTTSFVFALLVAAGISPMPIIDQSLNELPVELISWTGLRSEDPVVIGSWPPAEGDRYPDLILSDQCGQTVRLSDFAGKIILLELAAIPCQGCQAFAGGNQRGGFAGVAVQPGLDSIHHYADRFAGVNLGQDQEVVFVQLLLYGKSMTRPSQQEVTAWAEHFGMNRAAGEIVLRGDRSMLSAASYAMIPGFHLIDRDFRLRCDSSGHAPRHDLYRDLLPELASLRRQP